MDIFDDISLWDRDSALYEAVGPVDAADWRPGMVYEYNRAIPRAICLMSRAITILRGIDCESYSTA